MPCNNLVSRSKSAKVCAEAAFFDEPTDSATGTGTSLESNFRFILTVLILVVRRCYCRALDAGILSCSKTFLTIAYLSACGVDAAVTSRCLQEQRVSSHLTIALLYLCSINFSLLRTICLWLLLYYLLVQFVLKSLPASQIMSGGTYTVLIIYRFLTAEFSI